MRIHTDTGNTYTYVRFSLPGIHAHTYDTYPYIHMDYF